MSQYSSFGSGRICRTARSLMPDTLFVASATVIAFLLSIVAFLFGEFPYVFTLLAMACAISLGHLVCLYQKSERRRLVPGMNETSAAVAIFFSVALWLLNVAMIVAIYGAIPEVIGGTLLLIAFSLWLGWGERRIFHAFGFLFLVFLALLITPGGPVRIFAFYSELSPGARGWVGAGIGVVAVSMLCRFWTLTSSKIDPVAFKQKDDIFAYITSPDSWRGDAQDMSSDASVQMPDRLSTRIQWMVLGRNYWRVFDYCWGVAALAFVACVMLSARGHLEATAGFTCLASFVLAIVLPISFLNRVPQAFGRLWITGVSESRADTAAHLLKLTAVRAILCFLVPFALLVLQVPFAIDWWLTVLVALLVGLGVGGVLLWVVARWYVFWSDKTTFAAVCSVVCLGTVIGILIPFSSNLIPNLYAALGDVGRVPSLLVVALVVGMIWVAAIYDGARSLGASARLIECEVSPQQNAGSFLETF